MRARTPAAVVFTLVIAACGPAPSASEPSASQAAPSSPDATARPSATTASPATNAPAASQDGGQPVATADVSISGGGMPGDYRATLTSGGCSRDPLGENTFGVASVDVEASGGFDGPQLSILDAAAASGVTTAFELSLPFDNYETNLVMSPADGLGTGSLTLDDRGAAATIHIEGTLEDGGQVTVDIECHSVTAF
jgi:hypothetical protein